MKYSSFRVILTVFLLLFTAESVLAQSQVAVRNDVDINTVGYQLDRSGDTINVWISRDDASAYTHFMNGSPFKKVRLGDRFRVVNGHYNLRDNSGKAWSLLIKEKDNYDVKEIVGWVSHDSLLTNQVPLKNDFTNISQKVLIKSGDAKNGRGLSVYDNPEMSKSNEAIEVRTVFYVYDYYPKSAGRPESERTKSLLIGAEPQLDPYGDNAPLLIGWVDRDQVSFWATREGGDFSIGSKVRLETDNGRIQKFNITRPLSYNALRDPILSDEGDFLRVGMFAELSRSQLALRTSIGKISTGLEVLFVIDGTRSMTAGFSGTIKAVERISRRLQKEASDAGVEQPRFALAFYRDKPDAPAQRYKGGRLVSAESLPYCKKEVMVYRMNSINAFLKQLKSQYACDSDSSRPESVYLGLATAIKKCGFSKGAGGKSKRMRAIIHLGDAGDNRRGGYSAGKIASLMKKNSIFKYIAINVGVPGNGFSEAASPIASRLGNKGVYVDRPKDLTMMVIRHLRELGKQAVKLEDQINIMERGWVKGCQKGVGGVAEGRVGVVSEDIYELALEVLKANKVDLSKYEVFQQYVEGVVPKDSGMNKYVLVSQTDIEELVANLNRLIRSAQLESRRDAWDQTLKVILGDDTCMENGKEVTLQQCNKMRNGIPIRAGFMKMTRSRFLNLGREEALEVRCEAKQFLTRLRYILKDEKVVKIDMIDPYSCDFEATTDLDLNGDGIIVRDGYLINKDGAPAGKARPDQLEDKYMFKEGPEWSAWIPLDAFGAE